MAEVLEWWAEQTACKKKKKPTTAVAWGVKGYLFLQGFKKGLANWVELKSKAADTYAECSPLFIHGAGTAQQMASVWPIWLRDSLEHTSGADSSQPFLFSPLPVPYMGFSGICHGSSLITRTNFYWEPTRTTWWNLQRNSWKDLGRTLGFGEYRTQAHPPEEKRQDSQHTTCPWTSFTIRVTSWGHYLQ